MSIFLCWNTVPAPISTVTSTFPRSRYDGSIDWSHCWGNKFKICWKSDQSLDWSNASLSSLDATLSKLFLALDYISIWGMARIYINILLALLIDFQVKLENPDDIVEKVGEVENAGSGEHNRRYNEGNLRGEWSWWWLWWWWLGWCQDHLLKPSWLQSPSCCQAFYPPLMSLPAKVC